MCGFGDAVLLKSTVDGVPREQRLRAQRFVSLLAEVAGEARSIEPFDASVVSNLNVFDHVATSNNYPGSLMAAYERKFGGLAIVSVVLPFSLTEDFGVRVGAGCTHERPIPIESMQVSVADTRVL